MHANWGSWPHRYRLVRPSGEQDRVMTDVRFGARERLATVPPRANMAPGLAAAAVLLTGLTLAERGTPSHAVVWGSLALACYACSLRFLVTTRSRAGRT